MDLQVPPTLVAAVRALARDTVRGFTFVRPDGSERHLPFAEICREAERRAGHFVARGLTKGQRVALVIPDGDEFVLSFLGATFAGLVPVPITRSSPSRTSPATTTPSGTSSRRAARAFS